MSLKSIGKKLTDLFDANVARRVFGLLPFPASLFLGRLVSGLLAPLGALVTLGAYRMRPRPPLRVLLGIGYRMALGNYTRRCWFYVPGAMTAALARTRAEGREHLEAARREGGGLLLASLHCLDFRLLQLWINRFDPEWRPYLVRGSDPEPVVFDSAKGEIRHRQQVKIFEGRLLPARNGARRIVRILREGGTVLIAQDQRGDNEIAIFGRRARLFLGADRLAEITGARIVPVIVSAVPGRDHWVIRFWPAIEPEKGRTAAALRAAVKAMIEEYPEAWQRWNYLR